MEKQKALANQIGSQQTFEPLEKCIIDLVSAMKSDFGNKFKSQFEDEQNSLKQYKRRLYAKLRGHDVSLIYDAYELFLEDAPAWPPTVPELCAFLSVAEKNLKKTKERQEEADRLAVLPAPTIQCNPMEMFAKAKAEVREDETPEERATRRAALLQNHNAVITLAGDRIRKRYATHEMTCQAGGCNRAGTISGSTKGDGNFYCFEHFQAA